ncbi:polysaccharide biosynthesis tyrosine autokinase [Aeoliella sp. ICT_H6.2]|uniref:Polysaccharide biosynthesis tyrosine autokinase n=1 Tax=Aeoliella straminimaris TaxID=2954799 RepID=A0A9X2FFQ3_9BACT|nr:polysaccharide biosynthesis tyrosine autokinase [Aeoliella straminimaris]MCO6047433.1 polysaccharide biosynthesis tyrosine autokinase [Aeoliella straminimaris]
MTHTDQSQLSVSAAGGRELSTADVVHAVIRLYRTLCYRRHLVFGSMAVCAALGIAYYLTAPRYYGSVAELMISERKADELTSMGEQVANENLMANQQKLLSSPVVIRNAISELPEQYLVDLASVPRRDWVEDLTSRLSVGTSRKGSSMEVRYRSRDPEAAAAVVSAIVDSYLAAVEYMHQGVADESLEQRRTDLQTNKNQIEQTQGRLLALRQAVGHLAVGEQEEAIDPVVQRALQMNERWTEAQNRRVELQARLGALNASIERGEDVRQHLIVLEETLGQQMMVSSLGMSADDLTNIREREQEKAEAERELASLTPYLGPKNPRMIELNAKIRGIEQYLANYRASAGQRVAGLAGTELGPMLRQLLSQSVQQAGFEEEEKRKAFVAARQEATQQSSNLIHLRNTERELVRLENEHDALIEQIKTTERFLLQKPIQAMVTKDPLPEDRPVSPRLKVVGLLSLICGLTIGVTLAYVQDVLDDRFNSPEELSTQLGVPVLGLVQRLDPIVGQGLETVHTHVRPNDTDSEAFRTLRTSLALSTDGAERILISSAEPGDGKTTVSANLAVAFAQAGKRTLVIDADLRRPGMTTLLGLKGKPGVTDLLSSGQPPAQLAPSHVVQTDAERLHIIPAGLRRPNPAELLASKAFIELLAWADSKYDQVLVDCPPVLAVSDAQIVGRLVDGAVLVVRPDKNHRRLVARACENFRSTGSQVLGVVANDVSDMHGSGYGYGYGYSYQADEELDSIDEVSAVDVSVSTDEPRQAA